MICYFRMKNKIKKTELLQVLVSPDMKLRIIAEAIERNECESVLIREALLARFPAPKAPAQVAGEVKP